MRGGERTCSSPAALACISAYYGARIARFGPGPMGVDWTCVPTQQLRFVQLLRVVQGKSFFTLNDLGCGDGALLPFMRKQWRAKDFTYRGIDISAEMIACARQLHARRRNAIFEVGAVDALAAADYTIASGIFNVKLDVPQHAWTQHIETSLRVMCDASHQGIAVNFLQPLPRGVVGHQELYRAPPSRWAEFCSQALGLKVTLLADYGLREFTLLALKRG